MARDKAKTKTRAFTALYDDMMRRPVPKKKGGRKVSGEYTLTMRVIVHRLIRLGQMIEDTGLEPNCSISSLARWLQLTPRCVGKYIKIIRNGMTELAGIYAVDDYTYLCAAIRKMTPTRPSKIAGQATNNSYIRDSLGHFVRTTNKNEQTDPLPSDSPPTPLVRLSKENLVSVGTPATCKRGASPNEDREPVGVLGFTDSLSGCAVEDGTDERAQTSEDGQTVEDMEELGK